MRGRSFLAISNGFTLMTMNGIGAIARQGIARINDCYLRETLDCVYQAPEGIKAVETAQRVFERLTSSKWSADTLCRFLSGWRATHGTALFVSGLMIRVQREAWKVRETNQVACLRFHKAAAEIGEIISEDTGVDDVPHNERFVRFANQIVGDDRWQLNHYAMPACQRFRSYVKERRLAAPLEEAILTTMASESWNTGEYTYFNSLLKRWMIDILGCSAYTVEETIAYIGVHAGETELGHLLHVVKAWDLYCQAMGHNADSMKAARAFEGYLSNVGTAFEELEQVLW